MVAGSGRLDGRVEGQQIGLIGDATDRAGDLADRLRAPLEFGHQVEGGGLPLGIALDRPSRAGDLHSRLRQNHLDGLGAPPRQLRLAAGRAEAGDGGTDRGELLLRGAGGLLGAAGDLLHGPAELLGRGGGFGKTARQLLSGGGDPFGKPVLARGRARLARPHRRRRSRRRSLQGSGDGGGAVADLRRLDQSHGVPASVAHTRRRRPAVLDYAAPWAMSSPDRPPSSGRRRRLTDRGPSPP